MAFNFKDRVVVVTGGSSGLGRVMSQIFFRQGAIVCPLARNQARLEEVSREWQSRESNADGSSRCLPVVADVTKERQVHDAVERVVQQYGRVDVVVNAAGKSDRGAILNTTSERFQELWEVNFLGAVHTIRAAGHSLVNQRGHIINIGSLASKTASPFLGAYPASKFALAAYSHQLRLELEPLGVHVLLVCPGPLTRDDAGHRYDDLAEGLPADAHRPGGGARLKTIAPDVLTGKILRACERRQAELIVPGKVRALVTLAQWFPSWADAIIRKKTTRRDGQGDR